MGLKRMYGALICSVLCSIQLFSQTKYLHSDSDGVKWEIIPHDDVAMDVELLKKCGYKNDNAVKAVYPVRYLHRMWQREKNQTPISEITFIGLTARNMIVRFGIERSLKFPMTLLKK